MRIRLKVPFSSSLFFAIRVKKLQITFPSRLNSFATNSNKVLIAFTHNFALSALVSLSVKSFSRIRPSGYHFLTLTNQSASKKTRRQNFAFEQPIRDCLIKELNITKMAISWKSCLFLVHSIPLFKQSPVIFSKINLVFM